MTDSRHDPYTDPMEDYAGGPVVGNDGNFLADVDDDDAQVIDSLVDQAAEPPSGSDLPVVRIDMRPIPKDLPPALTRMVTRTVNLGAEPLLLLPANAYRSRVSLTATALTEGGAVADTAVLYLAASRTESQSFLTSARVLLGHTDTFDAAYNGELWAYSPNAGTSISILEYITQEVGR